MSSAQVEYLRYWLHAVGLTKEIIPIPSSEYLIKNSDLAASSPAIYNCADVLKKAVRVRANKKFWPTLLTTESGFFALKQQKLEKANKRLKGSNGRLTNRRLTFERVRTFWGQKTGTWMAVDFEAWEMDHNMVTEFGWSLVTWENGQEVRDKAHLIIEERKQYYNHKYVRGNRDVSQNAGVLVFFVAVVMILSK